MERQFKERLVGATLLVIAGVIFIPWLLDGKTNSTSVEQELVLPGSAKHNTETRTIALDAANPGGSSASTARSPGNAQTNENLPSATIENTRLPVTLSDTASGSAAQESRPVPNRSEPASEQPAVSTPGPDTSNDATLSKPATQVPVVASTPVKQPPAVFEDSIAQKKPVTGKKPAATNAVPVPEITGAKAWAVQVGSFSSQENADRLAEQLRGKNYKAFVMRNVVEGKVRFRVRVGPVGVRAEADLLAAALREDRQPAKVLSHP